MARDYENIDDIDELDDVELRDLVRERLGEHTALDLNDISVRVKDGHIELRGRVGTDGERRVADHVITDTLGIMEFSNNLVVDSNARAESPMAIDEQLADEAERSGTLLGDVPLSYEPGVEHLGAGAEDDLTGTADYEQVMEDGKTWNPPNSPTPEGMDAGPGEVGENH